MATHDYVIANQSGAAFRADLNNALAAIVSNNSNSSQPATRYAYQWWADTSAGVMKIRNSANDGWIELFQLDGTLTLEDGSNSAPALAFRDDLDTGIFSGGANEFNIATGGTERFVITSDGKCGIGVASPSRTLHVGSDFIRVDDGFGLDTSGATEKVVLDAGFIALTVASGEKARLTATGLGLGTTSPSNILEATGSSHTKLLVGTTGTGHATGLQITHADGDSGEQQWQLQTDATADGNLVVRNATSGNKVMIFDADVYGVSIGGIDPEKMFELGGSNNTKTDPLQANNILRFRDNDSTSTNGQPMGTITWTTGDSGNAGVSAYISCECQTANDGRGRMNFAAGSEANSTLTEVMHVDQEGLVCGGTGLAGDFGTESLRVNATNRIGFHTATHDANGICMVTNRSDQRATYTAINFHAQGVHVGGVVVNFSSTNFNTSSDYRIKENVVNLENAINRIKNLKPYRFNFIGDTSETIDGFFAHEVSEVVPNAVTGEKDAMKKGEIDPQSMDNSKLVPLLVAAVQELTARVETLEAA